jgi:hypothetical protein
MLTQGCKMRNFFMSHFLAVKTFFDEGWLNLGLQVSPANSMISQPWYRVEIMW